MIEVGNSGCKRFCRCNDCKVVFWAGMDQIYSIHHKNGYLLSRWVHCPQCKKAILLDKHEYGKPDNNFIELLNFLKQNRIRREHK
jgi:hypothetical protein